MSLIEDDAAPRSPERPSERPSERSNVPEWTVSEISGAVKRMVEGEFALVRVRGEVGRVSRAASGHVYFDLKDERSVLSAVAWKGTAQRLSTRPEEGLEVVATGRLTTFPGQSKYQMSVEDLQPAGAGALMAQLEARRARLAGEGLFEAARKRPIPFLPDVVGVVTSPQGAVIRDILHRLRDRFPRAVVVWPVAVQGANCAPEVARAVKGFNELPPGGPVPRPDVIIVARGGGSIEDLWGFNDEGVVRAVAASAIPVISAVGHETDTTLIALAADRRAPTPTAAAEMAVPVRAELLERVAVLGARAGRASRGAVGQRRQRLLDLARALPRGEVLVAQAQQRLDFRAAGLGAALRAGVAARRVRLADLRLGPGVLRRGVRAERRRLEDVAGSLAPALARRMEAPRERLRLVGSWLEPVAGRNRAEARDDLDRVAPRLGPLARRAGAEAWEGLRSVAERLTPELGLARARRLGEAVEALNRLRVTLGYRETLQRGFAVVRDGGRVVTAAADAERAAALVVEFRDGAVAAVPAGARPAPRRRAGDGGDRGDGGGAAPSQGSLL